MKQLSKLSFMTLFVSLLIACSVANERSIELNEQESIVLIMFYTEN